MIFRGWLVVFFTVKRHFTGPMGEVVLLATVRTGAGCRA